MALFDTTHYYMEQVERLCEHIAILDGGRTQAESTWSEVMAWSATSASSFEPSRPVVGRDVEIPFAARWSPAQSLKWHPLLRQHQRRFSTSTTRRASRGNGDR